jgi:hypothetical protein
MGERSLGIRPKAISPKIYLQEKAQDRCSSNCSWLGTSVGNNVLRSSFVGL